MGCVDGGLGWRLMRTTILKILNRLQALNNAMLETTVSAAAEGRMVTRHIGQWIVVMLKTTVGSAYHSRSAPSRVPKCDIGTQMPGWSGSSELSTWLVAASI